MALKIAVLSGKGGTGKTTVATNLAYALSEKMRVQLLDADVEEPNDHLFFDVDFHHEETVEILIPVVDKDKCILCGVCARECQFGAINVFQNGIFVFENLCHGCGVCKMVCPVDAITERPKVIGYVKIGRADGMGFGMGLMNIGEPSGVRIIRQLKKHVDENADVVVIDSPPGTSCPVVESLRGADFAILVTESSPFGLHDLKLAISMVREMKIPMGVVINRYDPSFEDLEVYLEEENIPVLMRIPFDPKIAKLYSSGTIFSRKLKDWREKFLKLYEDVIGVIGWSR